MPGTQFNDLQEILQSEQVFVPEPPTQHETQVELQSLFEFGIRQNFIDADIWAPTNRGVSPLDFEAIAAGFTHSDPDFATLIKSVQQGFAPQDTIASSFTDSNLTFMELLGNFSSTSMPDEGSQWINTELPHVLQEPSLAGQLTRLVNTEYSSWPMRWSWDGNWSVVGVHIEIGGNGVLALNLVKDHEFMGSTESLRTNFLRRFMTYSTINCRY